MKHIKFLSLFLTFILVLTAFCGCSEGEVTTNATNTDNNASSTASTESKTEDTAAPDSDAPYTALPEAFTAEKIGSVTPNSVHPGKKAVYYRGENGKYGIMSFDGSFDTGAKYASCSTARDFFEVSNTKEYDVNNISTLNSKGIVDSNDKEIVPMKYATIKFLNNRYVQVCEVTEQTTNEDEALVYFSKSQFVSLSPEAGDPLFKGVWYVYDLTTGKPVTGATGTKGYSVYAFGDFLKYTKDDGTNVNSNPAGEIIQSGADLFENSYYALRNADGNGSVYDSSNKKIFDFKSGDFIPSYGEGKYFVARKTNTASTTVTSTYAIMDLTGKVISAELPKSPSIKGDLLLAGETVYNIEGKSVVSGTFKSMYMDEFTEKAWFLNNDTNYTLIKNDGTILYQGAESNDVSIDPYNFTIRKKNGDKYLYYSFKDKDFTIEGSGFAPWIIKVSNPDYSYNLVDSLSGNTIISGYNGFSYAIIPGSLMYVYAQKADGGVDIYTVK